MYAPRQQIIVLLINLTATLPSNNWIMRFDAI